uniref:Uncharacterized protein n=1 Tax=Zonotrichia albicollis TaxID=44394 RepID=A0A8D2MUM7_ZONAL
MLPFQRIEIKLIFFISLLTVVTQKERESALNLYNPKKAWMMQSVAFEKRADTSVSCELVLKGFGNVQVMDLLCSFCRVPFEDPEDAVLVRAMTRSLMEFSSVDWNKVTTCQERRLENKAEEPPEKLTVQFR